MCSLHVRCVVYICVVYMSDVVWMEVKLKLSLWKKWGEKIERVITSALLSVEQVR